MKALLFILLLLSVTIFSCQKKDNITPDATKVTMIITRPDSAQVFRSGDTVHINATVSYPSELHGYEVKIIDTTTGYILYDDAQHVHDDHFIISDTWVCSGTQPAVLKLELIAEVDHNGTDAIKTLFFNYLP